MTLMTANKNIKLFNFILFYFISICLSSQPLEINTENGYTVFSDNGKFLILDKLHLHQYDGSQWSNFSHNLVLDNYDFVAVKNDSLNYLVARGGGKVLTYQNQKIEKADNSDFWNSKYQSSNFIRKNKLYSFAGYGHYQLRNDLIYFDVNLREWIGLFKTKKHLSHFRNDSPFLKNHISQYDESDDILYVGLGSGENGLNSEIFSYNFKTNEWIKTGGVDKVFSEYIHIEGYYPPSFIHLSDKKIYSFDLVNNFYEIYDTPNNLASSISNIYFDNQSEKFLIITKGVNSDLRYSISKKADFFNGSITPKSIVEEKNNNNLYIYSILLFVLILIPSIIILRLNRRITIQMILKSINKVNDSLIKYQKDFLTLIISNHPNSTKFNDLGNLFEFDLAYETKIKKINIGIEKINLVFKKTLLTKSNIVVIEKNEEDSRIKEVRLNLNAKKNKTLF